MALDFVVAREVQMDEELISSYFNALDNEDRQIPFGAYVINTIWIKIE